MTACKGQAATGLLPGPTSEDFSLKRAGRIRTVPKKAFFCEQLPGRGKGARVAARLGWHTAVRISSASQDAGQREGKPRRDASPPTGLPLLLQTYLLSLQGATAAFYPRAGGPWGAPTLTHVSGSLSAASGSLWTASQLPFRTRCSFNANLGQCAGGRAAGGMGRERGRCFS